MLRLIRLWRLDTRDRCRSRFDLGPSLALAFRSVQFPAGSGQHPKRMILH